MRKLAIIVCALAALIALIVQFPASWALGAFLPDGIKQTAQVSGTVWRGRIAGLQGSGPVEFQTHPSALLSGEAIAEFQTQVPGLIASGGMRPGKLSNVIARGVVSTFSTFDARLGGLNGDFILRLDALEFSEQCESASGQISTNVLASNFTAWRWQGPELSGPVRCEQGDLVMEMTGRDQGQSFDVNVRVRATGSYMARILVATSDPQAAAILPLFGFEAAASGYSLTESGQWR